MDIKQAQDCAVKAARAAGNLMRANLFMRKKVDAAAHHDLKLELDVRCQKLIERRLRSIFPGIGVLGEEGCAGEMNSRYRWVVDPIDGTVNFAYGIPHACVSIALQEKRKGSSDYQTLVGVVYDPFCEELWTAVRGGAARLNGQLIRVSTRDQLKESIIAVGFAKRKQSLDRMLPCVNQLLYRARKIRIMGSAALSLVYVATGRMDAYIEVGLRLWDIAAGGLILECAGGEFWRRPFPGRYAYQLIANNGLLRSKIQRIARSKFQ